MKNNYNKLINENPEFQHFLFDVKDGYEFIKTHFDNDVLTAYETLIPYSFKSDLFRFCYMYIHGGIYIDIKYEAVNGFKLIELVNKEYLVDEPLWIQTCLLSLQPNNKLMFNCIQQIVVNTKSRFYGHSALLTGPRLLFDKYDKKELIHSQLKWKLVNDLHEIRMNDTLILIQYKEYRNDLKEYSDQPHYTTLFINHNIYTPLKI